MNTRPLRLNAGTGMAAGAIFAFVIALVVQLITDDTTIWIWAVPVGVAIGLAIGAGAKSGSQKDV